MLDLLIHNGIVVTMAQEGGTGVINCGAVGIRGNAIAVVGESGEVMRRCRAHRMIDATGKVVMPGLIDAHLHSDIGLFKGLAQDTDNWMQDCIWPLTEEMRPEESKTGSMINLIEAVKAGTTTMCDYDESMRLLVENHVKLETRACVAQDVFALPKNASETPIGEIYQLDSAIENEMLEESKKLINEYHMSQHGRITCMLGPQAPDRVSRALLEEVGELSRKDQHSIHMHVACGDRETNQMMLRYGKRTIPFLDELGLLNERMIGVHLSVATPAELRRYAESGSAMVLCSGSEAIIDGNIPPAFAFDKYSTRLAFGSDQTPGGNTSNMFNEMKFTAILNKCKYENPVLFPSWKMLRIATIDGARAIGMGDQIGSLEVGKKADVILS
ncbi:MAG TPA: amidohydrolase family protein, partial [Armatimonadota bacterium]|nr:amidohydrolase family protein [Armatimonadota bacterium]